MGINAPCRSAGNGQQLVDGPYTSIFQLRSPRDKHDLKRQTMHTALIGASRGIGRATALDLLQDPSNKVSLLLRLSTTIENDVDFAASIKEGRVRIVKGDANNEGDLRRLLDHDGIDSVVFTLGNCRVSGSRGLHC
jgi:hypothetical protein